MESNSSILFRRASVIEPQRRSQFQERSRVRDIVLLLLVGEIVLSQQ
ncbi:MAG: hypothetical protein ACYTX0_53875 [Nostoc sp.]